MLDRQSRLSLVGLFLPLLLLLGGVSRPHHAPASARQPLELKVIAFNTHLLPRIALGLAGNRGQGACRAQAIGTRLARYDLVGLSEVFDDERRTELIGRLQQVSGDAFHQVWYPRPRGGGFANSGLLLLSRFPIESHHLLTYRHASRFLTHGFRADSFASKGAIHARIRLGGEPAALVDCFLTHLESRSAAARARQLEDLARFIAEHSSPERPAILMGDLNVAADFPIEAGEHGEHGESPYVRLLATLRSSGVDWNDVWSALDNRAGGTSAPETEHGGRRIDYVFVSAPCRAASHALRPKRVAVERFIDPQLAEGTLSDHAVVECLLEWQPGNSAAAN